MSAKRNDKKTVQKGRDPLPYYVISILLGVLFFSIGVFYALNDGIFDIQSFQNTFSKIRMTSEESSRYTGENPIAEEQDSHQNREPDSYADSEENPHKRRQENEIGYDTVNKEDAYKTTASSQNTESGENESRRYEDEEKAFDSRKTPPVKEDFSSELEEKGRGETRPFPGRIHKDALVAIVIDDFGNNMNYVDDFCSLDVPVTFAVLPYLKYSKESARRALDSGKAVILHLPMENHSGRNPGPGALRVEMDPDELIQEFKMNLSFVPGAEGFNNHEGSLFTENEEAMKIIMKTAAEKGLFFLDSRTSPQSKGIETARAAGIPAAGRNVFLDNEDDVDYIKAQLMELAQKALSQGSAIGIGHVRSNTYTAIKESIPRMQEMGIRFVLVRELVQ